MTTTRREIERSFHYLHILMSSETKERLQNHELDENCWTLLSEDSKETLRVRFLEEFKGDETDRNFLCRLIANIQL